MKNENQNGTELNQIFNNLANPESTSSWNARDAWFYDHPNRQWRVKLEDGTIIKEGDQVQVKFDNGTFSGWVKQVAGFGMHEHRPVISVVFNGKRVGKKVLITNVTKR